MVDNPLTTNKPILIMWTCTVLMCDKDYHPMSEVIFIKVASLAAMVYSRNILRTITGILYIYDVWLKIHFAEYASIEKHDAL